MYFQKIIVTIRVNVMTVIEWLLFSVALPGIVYDLFKEGGKITIEAILKKYSERKEKKSKKNLKIFIKYREFILLVIILFVILFINFIFFHRDNEENLIYKNDYIYGNYTGLIKSENPVTPMQKVDTEFYINDQERSRGRYIHALQYSMDNSGMDHYDIEQIYDVYQSQLISLCQLYDNAQYKSNAEQVDSSDWKLIKKDKGVYIEYGKIGPIKKDFYNTFLYEYYDSEGIPNFVIGKCLYWGEHDIVVIMFVDSGETYDEFEKRMDEKTMLLKNCFESFQQIYKEGTGQNL